MSSGWVGGNFSISINMSARAVAGENIEASAFSALHYVIRAGVDGCVHKGGQNNPTADLPMAGFKHTNVGAPNSTTNYQRVLESISQYPVYLVDQESLGSTTISANAGIWNTVTSAGTRIQVKMAKAKPSASATTMAVIVNGSSHPVRLANGKTTLPPKTFASAGIHELVFDGANWVLMNPNKAAVEFTGNWKALDAVKVQIPATVVGGNPKTLGVLLDGPVARIALTSVVINTSTSAPTYLTFSALPAWVSARPNMVTGIVPIVSTATRKTVLARVSGRRVHLIKSDLSVYATSRSYTVGEAALGFLVTTSSP